MTLETFFEKFDLFADATDAVAKMRELVRQLAVQGRLVAQCPQAKPADALAAAISEDRAAFVKARSLARQRVFDPVAEEQRPFVLPSGWVWTRLGNLCRVQAGFAFESAAFVQGDSGVPMIRIRDITSDRPQVNYLGEYREEFLVETGDYLVGMDGNFTVAKWRGPRALLNQRVSRLQWYSKHLEPSFFAIAAQYRLTELQGTKAYTTVDHLSSGQIETAVVPLPPLAEQKRIVAKVDELMALCDRLALQQEERETRHAALARASLARFADAPTPANLDFLFHKSYAIPPAALRKSILTLAVQGKLVPQDPNDEPAEELVTQVGRDRERIAKGQGVRLPKSVPALTANNYPHDIPESWQWSRIGNLALVIDYGTSQKADSDSRKVPVYRMGNITGGRLVAENLKYVDAGIDDLPGLYLKTHDILFNRTNSYELVGKVGIYTGPDNKATFASYLIRIRLPDELLFPPFFSLAMNASYFRQTQIEPEVIQQCGQANFNGTKLASTVEQRRIVAKVDELMALVDALETQLATARTTATALLAAAVAELTTA